MSLIDQALKRAQAAQAGAGAPTARPCAPTPLPDRRRGRLRRLRQAFFAAVLLVLVAAGVFRLVGRTSGSAGARSAFPSRDRPDRRVFSVPGPLPEVFVPPPPKGHAIPRNRPRRPTQSEDLSDLKAPEASSPPGGNLKPPATQDRKAPRENRIWTGEFSPPGAGKIELEGVVYSETHPVALINGRVAEVGEVIEGLTLTEIQPDRVKLEGGEGTIWIRLKEGLPVHSPEAGDRGRE